MTKSYLSNQYCQTRRSRIIRQQQLGLLNNRLVSLKRKINNCHYHFDQLSGKIIESTNNLESLNNKLDSLTNKTNKLNGTNGTNNQSIGPMMLIHHNGEHYSENYDNDLEKINDDSNLINTTSNLFDPLNPMDPLCPLDNYYGVCCFCQGECNPCSQACGICIRNG